MLLKYGIVCDVGDDGECEFAMEFEPLRALAPLGEFDCGLHVWTVASTARLSWLVEAAQEAEGRAGEVGVGGLEVE